MVSAPCVRRQNSIHSNQMEYSVFASGAISMHYIADVSFVQTVSHANKQRDEHDNDAEYQHADAESKSIDAKCARTNTGNVKWGLLDNSGPSGSSVMGLRCHADKLCEMRVTIKSRSNRQSTNRT